jgi:hypothetical protein
MTKPMNGMIRQFGLQPPPSWSWDVLLLAGPVCLALTLAATLILLGR